MSLTLDDLVARNVGLRWWEAVAVVQGVCGAAITRSGGDEPRVPDADAVILTADGIVALTAQGPDGGSAVVRAATLLQSLLADADAPAALGLLVITALSPAPRYASLQELSEALEYYERPDRRAVLAATYERARRLPAGARTVPSPPADDGAHRPYPTAADAAREAVSFVPLPALDEHWEDAFRSEAEIEPAASWRDLAERTRSRAGKAWSAGVKARAAEWQRAGADARRAVSRWPRQRLFAAACVPVVTMVVGGWWLWPRAAESRPQPGVTSRPAGANTAAAQPQAPEVPSATASANVSPPPPPVSCATGRRHLRLRDACAVRQTGRTAFVRADASARPHRILGADVSGASQRHAVAGFAPRCRCDGARARSRRRRWERRPASPLRRGDLPEPRLGRPGTWGAEGPRLLRRRRRRASAGRDPPPVLVRAAAGVSAGRLTQIEILVSDRGEVVAAKAVSGPRSYFDGMVLSAVKAWKFQPATRNGLPVAYRLRVFLLVG